jgi:hypothetical protein
MNRVKTFRLYLLLMLLYLFLYSCKTSETIPETRLRTMSAGRLLKNIEESAFDYTHFNIKRINVQIDDGESKTSFRAGMQAVKDDQIQISVTKFNIPLGRIALSNDSVLFVNYLERTFITGGYKVLSNYLDFDLDFNIIQSIFSGNIFSFFEDEDELRDFKTYVDQGMYTIQSEKMRKIRKIDEKGKAQKMERLIKRQEEEALVLQTFYFDPLLFVLKRMILEDKTNFRKLELSFGDYSRVGDKYYPGAIDFKFISGEGTFSMDARMSGFSTEVGELTPLKIPEKYQRLFLN